MSAAEYREMLGLDPVTSTKTKATIKSKGTEPLGQTFNTKMRRLFLRLIWLGGWAWMIFTFGWPGYVITKLAERNLKKS